MTDRYQEIRAALAMGPTPGPWQDIGPIGAGKLIKAPEGLIAVVYGPNVNPASEANAHLAAACDPDTIRELLAERDQLAAALEAAREDAERYRWLRDREIPEWLDLWHQNPDRIDAAIDQARGKEGE